MFPVPTLFILGAGAGRDIGMPVGSELSGMIVDKLDIRCEDGLTQTHGDPVISRALNQIASSRRENVDQWLAAGRTVAKGIEYTRSIDAYINAHKDNEKIKDCAKLAIVQSILQKEGESAIFVGPDGNWKDSEKVRKSWFPVLMHLLQEQIVASENLDRLFHNIKVINFNYDRCLQHFLFRAVQDLYQKAPGEAAKVVSKLTMFHPYGSVGKLPWEEEGGRKIGYGVADYHDIVGLAKEILTFNEQLSDELTMSTIREEIEKARRIVFLGFHFHRQNMDLLQGTGQQSGHVLTVYSTSQGRSGPELMVIRDQIPKSLGNGRACQIEMTSSLDCVQLLSQFGTTLLRDP
jgi:hypothetical protein